MENCFENIIGVARACESIASTSGFFVEDIGINSDECDSFINSEYKSGLDLIKDKLSFASKLIQNTVFNEISGKINTKSIIDSKILGQHQDNLQMKPGNVGLGGMAWQLNNTGSYLTGFINSISLQLDYTGNVDVFIYDLVTTELLDTIKIACEANKISTKIVNKSYSSPKRNLDLLIVYDTTGKNSNNTILYQGCGSCQGYRYTNYYLNASPVYLGVSDLKLRNSLKGSEHTFGLSINYSIQCSLDKWICQISNQMALPILYKTGELIMEYALLNSDRINSETMVDAERNEKRKDAFSNEYNKILKAKIKGVNLPKGDTCFYCNDSVRSVTVLP